MAPFEGFTSIFRGGAKSSRAAHEKSEDWLHQNAVAVVHLAAIRLGKGDATFSFEALLSTAKEITSDVPLSASKIRAVLSEAEIEQAGDHLKLAV